MKMTNRGSILIEQLIAIFVGVILLIVAWRAYASLSRQDATTRHVADRVQTYAAVQSYLQRDLEARCLHEVPQVEAGGRAMVIPPHVSPSGAADGPRGAAALRWDHDPATGQFRRNGRPVGLPVAAGATFALLREPGSATVTLGINWRPGPSETSAARPWSRLARSWPVADGARLRLATVPRS